MNNTDTENDDIKLISPLKGTWHKHEEREWRKEVAKKFKKNERH